MDGGLSVQCGIRDSLSFARTTWMDELPRWQRLSSAKLQSGKKCRKVATSFFCLGGRCLSSTSRLCAFPCSVHPAQGKRCAPCLRASSASCLQSPATIYPHLQAASSICSSATLPSYSRRCEIGGSFHHPPRFSFSSPATAKSSRLKLLKRYFCRTFPHL